VVEKRGEARKEIVNEWHIGKERAEDSDGEVRNEGDYTCRRRNREGAQNWVKEMETWPPT